MLPFVFEWQWDVGHFVFMGLFYAALTVIGLFLAYCFASSFKDVMSGRGLYHHGHDDEHGHDEPSADEEGREPEAQPAAS